MVPCPSFHFFNKLPRNVKRMIFELAYEDSNCNAVELTYVSREVRSWIEPRVYEGILISRNKYAPLRVNRIRYNMLMTRLQTQREPRDLYTKYIQRLVISELRLASTLLPLCKNLTSLALLFPPGEAYQATIQSLFTSYTLSFPKLRRLYLHWELLPPEQRSLHNPIFRSLTHLEVDYCREIYWSGFSSLENLTNLCLDFRYTRIPNGRDFGRALNEIIHVLVPNLPPNLKYFPVMFQSRYAVYAASEYYTRICWDIEMGKYDSRLLLDWSSFAFVPPTGHILSCDLDFVCSWIYSPSCYEGYWRRVELEIENRNRICGLV